MSCPICTHDGATELGKEVKYVPRPWFRKVVTGVILGCTKCGKVRIERKDGAVFLLNCLKSQPVASGVENSKREPLKKVAHDRDMRWEDE